MNFLNQFELCTLVEMFYLIVTGIHWLLKLNDCTVTLSLS